MTNSEPAPGHEQVAFLSIWTKETRENPTRFARGAALLQREFSFEEIEKRREKRNLPDDTPRPARRRRRARELREVHSGTARFRWPRDEVLAWARERPPRMSSIEAEAVLLVAVFFYDNEPAPNPALPPTLRQIPVGKVDPPGEDPNWLDGREIVMAVRFDNKLLEAARHAASRIGARFSRDAEPNREDRAYEAFLVACRENKELDQDMPGKAHHDWLKEHRRVLLETKGDLNPLNWMRYARGGRRKHKGPVERGVGTPTRSVRRRRDLDHDRDTDS
jgi:hypothetical protein